MKKTLVLAALALFLTALTASAQIQNGIWTAVGSTGQVDPRDVGNAQVINGTRLGFFAASATRIVTRFNVTNIWTTITDTPPWYVMELGATNTSPNDTVNAILYQVDRCTGTRLPICTVTHSSGGASCVTCSVSTTNPVDFANYLYYIEVTIGRPAGSAASPQLTTLRLRW